jgi:RHS repeat-associated protein
MLHSMEKDGVTAVFTYDHTGLRVKKSVNGTDTLYTLNGKKVTHIRKGPNNAAGPDAIQLHFFYDAQGRPAIMQHNGADYAYLHNLQGDVTGLVDMGGALVVQYVYDAWGRPVATGGSMAGTLGHDNPFRYRGYVWDEETGLYLAAARYYDPEWGRWLNADALMGTTGALLSHNLFAYCLNNPIMLVDPDGKAAIGAVASAGPVGWVVGAITSIILLIALPKPAPASHRPPPGTPAPNPSPPPNATPAPNNIIQFPPLPYNITDFVPGPEPIQPPPTTTPRPAWIYRRGEWALSNFFHWHQET